MTESVETCVLIANCDRLLDCHAKSICGRELSKIGLCDLVPVAVSAPRRANVLTEELIISRCKFSNAKVCRPVPVANKRPWGLSLKSSCCATQNGSHQNQYSQYVILLENLTRFIEWTSVICVKVGHLLYIEQPFTSNEFFANYQSLLKATTIPQNVVAVTLVMP